jgi:hypothetical protein
MAAMVAVKAKRRMGIRRSGAPVLSYIGEIGTAIERTGTGVTDGFPTHGITPASRESDSSAETKPRL